MNYFKMLKSFLFFMSLFCLAITMLGLTAMGLQLISNALGA